MAIEPEKLEHLLELAAILGRQNDFQETLRVVAQKAISLLNAETAILAMINPQTRQTVKTIMREGQEQNAPKFHAVQMHVSGWIIKHRQPFASTDPQTDPSFTKNLFKGLPFKTVFGAPLWIEGVIIGTLILLNIEHPASSIQYLEKFAAIVAPYLHHVQKIQEYFATPLPEEVLLAKYEALGLLGRSKPFLELLKAIEAAARADVRVLLEGQSGTAKELVARAIHRLSARCNHAFVAIDCGAIPPNLIESELFGHARGAFTGATTDRKGLLEEADHGTLFMDEIASLPLDMQAKFMRVLQEGEFRPVGSNKIRTVNVRVISASSNSLRKLVDEQKFREDLYFRLHVYPIHVPSLDEHQEDIPLLANHFLKKFAAQQQKQAESFHEDILAFMQQRHWAGNIRELENLVERLVTLTAPNMTILDRDILPLELRKEWKKLETSPIGHEVIKPLYEAVAEYEEQLIRQALLANKWNIAKTARTLRVAEHTLRYKMGQMGIVRSKT